MADVGPLPYAIIDETAARLPAPLEQVATAKLTRAEKSPDFDTADGLERARHAKRLRQRIHREPPISWFSGRVPEVPERRLYAGERADILRRVNGTLLIARRDVVLDHAVLQGNISTLF